MAAKLMPPIDLTGEPTVWAFQDLQFFDGLGRVWRRESVAPQFGPVSVWRAKLSDLEAWDPYRAWPIHMGEHRGGYRARLLVFSDRGQWQPKRVVTT